MGDIIRPAPVLLCCQVRRTIHIEVAVIQACHLLIATIGNTVDVNRSAIKMIVPVVQVKLN